MGNEGDIGEARCSRRWAKFFFICTDLGHVEYPGYTGHARLRNVERVASQLVVLAAILLFEDRDWRKGSALQTSGFSVVFLFLLKYIEAHHDRCAQHVRAKGDLGQVVHHLEGFKTSAQGVSKPVEKILATPLSTIIAYHDKLQQALQLLFFRTLALDPRADKDKDQIKANSRQRFLQDDKREKTEG